MLVRRTGLAVERSALNSQFRDQDDMAARQGGGLNMAAAGQVWAPLMYFEYETLSRVAARRSDVYLDLLQLLHS